MLCNSVYCHLHRFSFSDIDQLNALIKHVANIKDFPFRACSKVLNPTSELTRRFAFPSKLKVEAK